MQGIGKRFVYILRSISDPSRHYVGITSDELTRPSAARSKIGTTRVLPLFVVSP
jgi:hypothetical protein